MKILEWLGQWTIVRKDEHVDCVSKEKYLELANSKTYYENLASDQMELVRTLAEKVADLQEQIPVDEPNPFKKHKNEKIYYNAPNRKLLTSYIKYEKSPVLFAIAQDIIDTNSLSSNDKDGVVLAVTNWWIPRFGKKNSGKEYIYIKDRKEYWQTITETLTKKEGDCDDYQIMLYSIIRQVFKNLECWEEVKERLICNAGNTNVYNSCPGPAGGHAYLSWIAEDGEEYTVETTYYPEIARGMFLKKPKKLNTAYGVIWFSWCEDKMIRRHWI